MKLRDYIEREGQPISRGHPEIARLAQAVGISPYTLYVVALGHKTLGIRKTALLLEVSGDSIDADSVCADYPIAGQPRRKKVA